MEQLNHSRATVTVEILTKSDSPAPQHPNDVDFLVKYPDGYTGQKHMAEGVRVVSREIAEQFSKMGIGEIVAPAPAVQEPEPAPEADTTPETESTPEAEQVVEQPTLDPAPEAEAEADSEPGNEPAVNKGGKPNKKK